MRRKLRFTPIADEQLTGIENDPALKGVLKQVRKTLGYLETNLRAKSLQTHEYESLTKRYGKKVFEAYAQQKTPAAYRIFWHYGPDKIDSDGKRIPIITIVAITPHPE
ncbi:MAG: hypothetical protein A2Z76_03985 [Chloroflexi bacterium RBG_13_56_8b]|nr:MAG: hypothetical protein A2Z76_03985 [Chloroflexi bacterium RBG_13_56_8b]